MWATAPYGYRVVGFPKRRAIEFRTDGSRARKVLVKGSLETRREGGAVGIILVCLGFDRECHIVVAVFPMAVRMGNRVFVGGTFCTPRGMMLYIMTSRTLIGVPFLPCPRVDCRRAQSLGCFFPRHNCTFREKNQSNHDESQNSVGILS